MKLRAHHMLRGRGPRGGFSLVELVLSLAVLLIITTLAIPVVVRSLQTYQLNSVASQLSGMLKFTKFEAIRQNTPVSCQIQQQTSNWLIWVDSNGNLTPDGAEPRMLVSGSFTLLPSGSVPSPAPIIATLGSASTLPWTVLSGTNTSVTYDQRGVLQFAGGATVYALYLGNPNDPNSGYRAIITLPSGAVQVWTSDSTGNWQRVS
jgi:prepilin-type N-terminal cleavage/methylation domain-containing protein